MDLGKRLRQLRERCGMSIYDVERKARLHFSTISKYERNERQPSIEVLQELAEVYGVPLASIFAETEDLRQFLPAEEIEWLTWLRQDRRLVELVDAARRLPPARLQALVDFLRPEGPTGRDTSYPAPHGGRQGRSRGEARAGDAQETL